MLSNVVVAIYAQLSLWMFPVAVQSDDTEIPIVVQFELVEPVFNRGDSRARVRLTLRNPETYRSRTCLNSTRCSSRMNWQ